MTLATERILSCAFEPCSGRLGEAHAGVRICGACGQAAVRCDGEACEGWSADVAKFCRECGRPLQFSHAPAALSAEVLARLRLPVDPVKTRQRFTVAPVQC